MNKHQEMSTFENEIGKAETWEAASAEERVQRLNEITFAALSSLQQEMLTYNLDKSMIKSLVKRICSTMTSFPEDFQKSMIKKIDEYVQVPFSTSNSNVSYARQYLSEPAKDPLFYETDRLEEHKKLSSQYTSDTIINLQGSGLAHQNQV